MRTFDDIMRQALARVPDDVDKREGSIIYDALAPAAMEFVNLYAANQYTQDQAFADTADRGNLIRRATERGYSPYPATKALLKGEFVPSVPIGARFNLDDLNYVVLSQISGIEYRVECETLGTAGNRKLGTLLPIDYIDGLESAKLTAVLIPGEDEEATEAFRERYLSGFDSQSFGGNIADYKEKVGALPGVGEVKVYPAANGGGTVTVVILTSDNMVPTAELVGTVQEKVDPPPQGYGIGLAPIDHVVTIEGAQPATINVTATIEYKQGYAWSSVEDAANAAVEAYFSELRAAWAEEDNLIVRVSQIETRLLEIDGVADIGGTTLNGAAANLTLEGNQVPVKGAVSG